MNNQKKKGQQSQSQQLEIQHIKYLDKIGFTMGVFNICICQYIFFNIPLYFPLWYSIVMSILIITRYYHYHSLSWQYSMYDFCYFIIVASFFNNFLIYYHDHSFLLSDIKWWLFKILFIHACGTLPPVIPVYRNSIVFHDCEKMISFYIHILPSMLFYTIRWSNHFISDYCPLATTITIQHTTDDDCHSLQLNDFISAYSIYMIWQCLYLWKTEIADKQILLDNPRLFTSLRWLTQDTTNITFRTVLTFIRWIGFFNPEEEYDGTTVKTKFVFVTAQSLFTAGFTIPSYWFYKYQTLHFLSIVLMFGIAVFNGASYYIDIFSNRYEAELLKLTKTVEIEVNDQIENIDAKGKVFISSRTNEGMDERGLQRELKNDDEILQDKLIEVAKTTLHVLDNSIDNELLHVTEQQNIENLMNFVLNID